MRRARRTRSWPPPTPTAPPIRSSPSTTRATASHCSSRPHSRSLGNTSAAATVIAGRWNNYPSPSSGWWGPPGNSSTPPKPASACPGWPCWRDVSSPMQRRPFPRSPRASGIASHTLPQAACAATWRGAPFPRTSRSRRASEQKPPSPGISPPASGVNVAARTPRRQLRPTHKQPELPKTRDTMFYPYINGGGEDGR